MATFVLENAASFFAGAPQRIGMEWICRLADTDHLAWSGDAVLLGQTINSSSDVMSITYLLIAQAAAPNTPSSSMFLMPLLVIGLLYYVMVVRPEQRHRTDHTAQLNELKQNDRVVTAGGIHGVVVKANSTDSDVVVRIDESNNTKIHIQRSSISRVVSDKDKSTDSQES
mgnify:CR=1 FL=1